MQLIHISNIWILQKVPSVSGQVSQYTFTTIAERYCKLQFSADDFSSYKIKYFSLIANSLGYLYVYIGTYHT